MRPTSFFFVATCICWIGFPSIQKMDSVAQQDSITVQNDKGGAKKTVPRPPQDRQIEFFESRIRPVLVQHCYPCHSDESGKQKGGLLLDSRPGTHRGGDTGAAVVPGKVDASLLIGAIRYEDFEMPPEGKLPERVILDFEKWIEEGAADPRTAELAAAGRGATVNAAKKRAGIDWQSARKFWSFLPPRVRSLPPVKDPAWPNNRIDYFVQSAMENRELHPARSASVRELNRRLAFDLTGLPPGEIREDLDQLTDELLASKSFGEKWARHWLDLARYAEDQAHIVGNNQALFYPNAYLYRDWVIDAFNRDLSYDQFVMQQLSADLVAAKEKRTPGNQELAALGFIGLGPKYYRRNDLAVMADEWEDRVDTVSRGLLGLTVACARCHDHKYDPISTQDYYALAGVFASTEMYNKPLQENPQPEAGKKSGKAAPGKTLHIVRDTKKPRNLNVFIRGDSSSKGPIVERRFLTLLDDTKQPFGDSNSGRLALAKAITRAENPLFARVIVNRVWTVLVGKPLVGTPSNFGELGERPSHPALLDDLAARFMQQDWSIKWLVREIVSSATYRQSSLASSDSMQADPGNRLISRMNRKRLTVEQWRDAILDAGSQLDHRIGGPSMDPANPAEKRRTIYARVSRFQLNSMLAMFDFPDPNAHAAQRSNTISPLQKMFALNSRFLLEQTKKLADRIQQTEKKLNDEEFIETTYQLLFQRPPNTTERSVGRRFLENDSDSSGSKRSSYLQSLIISNEFTYID
ncbi:MAG: PSD1 and planctomycete cytochrome C domain-containing protein [Planctomycetota bacterium]|nr:PSD1 and planctomycete cytochrome C domain-containing protein [Planctomycetota bacterium]